MRPFRLRMDRSRAVSPTPRRPLRCSATAPRNSSRALNRPERVPGHEPGTSALGSRFGWRENRLPVALHVDDGPAFAGRFVHKVLGEGADFGIWQPARLAVGIFA